MQGQKPKSTITLKITHCKTHFFEQVFRPLFDQVGEKEGYLSIIGDDRKKPEKFVRIEGNLEPLSRNGQLIFNIDEKDNPNMKRLEDQFLTVNPQLSAPCRWTRLH